MTQDFWYGLGFGAIITASICLLIATVGTTQPTMYTGTVQSATVTNGGNTGQVIITLTNGIASQTITCNLQATANNAVQNSSIERLQAGDNIVLFQYGSFAGTGACMVSVIQQQIVYPIGTATAAP